MKRIVLSIILTVFAGSMMLHAAQPTITKSFKKTPLVQVLKTIEKKSGYTIIYNPEEINEQQPVTVSLKDARVSSALRRVLGKGYDIQVKKKIVTIKKKVQPTPEATPVVAPQPTEQTTVAVASDSLQRLNVDSIRTTVTVRYETHQDSMMEVKDKSIQQPAAVQPEPKYAHMSHHLIAKAGGGWHGAGGDVNYAFFFHDHWGISVGLGVDYYAQLYGQRDTLITPDAIDSDGETYRRERTTDLDQRRDILTVNIPIALQCYYPVGEKARLYASLGVRTGLPIIKQFGTRTGTETIHGYYDRWHMTIDDIYDFGTKPYEESGAVEMPTVTIAPAASFGVTFPVNDKVDMGVGVYGNCIVNSPLYPYQAGIQLAVRWHQAAKTKPYPTVYETVTVKDTTWRMVERIDTIRTVRYDTIMHPVQAIAHLQETSIIWFDLNDATPKVDPVDLLDRLAAILIENPEQHILINGHSCSQGSKKRNAQLSVERAQAVADILIQKGVNPDQLQVHGYGDSKPYYSKSHDLYLDRRVEIVPVER